MLAAFAKEYYSTGWDSLPDEPDLSINSSPLTAQEVREAYRALKGQAIRQEIYGQDGSTLAGIPYLVTANSFAVKRLQPVDSNLYGCFYSYKQQGIEWHCERVVNDPRVLHDRPLMPCSVGRRAFRKRSVRGPACLRSWITTR